MAGKLQLISIVPDPGGRYTIRNYQWLPSAVAGKGYTTGGDTGNFATATNPTNQPRALLPALPVPAASAFTVNQSPAGYELEIILNTVAPTIKNYLFKVYDIHNGAELSQADYPAGITGDVNGFTFSVQTPKKSG